MKENSVRVQLRDVLQVAQLIETKSRDKFPEARLNFKISQKDGQDFEASTYAEFEELLKDVRDLRLLKLIKLDASYYYEDFDLGIELDTRAILDRTFVFTVKTKDKAFLHHLKEEILNKLQLNKTLNWYFDKDFLFVVAVLTLSTIVSTGISLALKLPVQYLAFVMFGIAGLAFPLLILVQKKLQQRYPLLVLEDGSSVNGRVLADDVRKARWWIFLLVLGGLILTWLGLS